jgi:hypothetical protein
MSEDLKLSVWWGLVLAVVLISCVFRVASCSVEQCECKSILLEHGFKTIP